MKEMCKFIKKFLVLILGIILGICGFNSRGECREVVFVLNSGQSMNSSDPFRVAPESIIWATQNFSADDEVGIVTFKDEVSVIRPLSKVGDNPALNFSADYYGHSNAGAGILTAIDMLSPKFNTQRDIIFITDGEIQNAQSAENFKAGLKQAQWLEIPVYLVNLRHNVNPQNYREYDNVKFLPINYNELLTTIRTILQGDFNLPHISLPTNNLTSGTLNFEIPVTLAEHVKISLFSSKTGNAHLKNIQPNESFQGNFVKIFDVNSSSNNFEIDVDYPQGAGLTLDVVPTVAGTLQTRPSTKFFIKDILEITPVYANTTDSKILSDKFFDGKHVNLKINDKNVAGVIQNGTIQVPLDELDENISLQKVHFEDVGITFNGDDTAQVFAPKRHYGAWLLALAGVLIIAFLVWRIRDKQQKATAKIENAREMLSETEKGMPFVEETSAEPVTNKSASYNGKLVLYVTKISEEEDFSPREFNLFRMNVEKIPLSYVLEKCSLFGIFPNAKNIFISPDRHGIFLENDSDCTITKRNSIIEKGGRVEMYYNDSVNIASKDETSEMIMIYKSLKPV